MVVLPTLPTSEVGRVACVSEFVLGRYSQGPPDLPRLTISALPELIRTLVHGPPVALWVKDHVLFESVPIQNPLDAATYSTVPDAANARSRIAWPLKSTPSPGAPTPMLCQCDPPSGDTRMPAPEYEGDP